MCAAVLSAFGTTFDPYAFLAGSTLREDAECWRDGEGRHRSGFQIVASDARDVKLQIEGSIEFIREHAAELKRLRDFAGVEGIDVRIAYFWYEDFVTATCSMPEELHLALANIRATLTLCVYPCSGKDPNKKPTVATPPSISRSAPG